MSQKPDLVLPDLPPPAAADPRSRQVWLVNKRQELLAPARALLELSEMMLRHRASHGRPDFLRDQQQIRTASAHLLSMIAEVLDPSQVWDNEEELARRVRHDLRTPLTEVIGLCELWLEDGTDLPQDLCGQC